MTTEELEQIRKIIREENEPLKQGQARIENRLGNVEQGQAHTTTAVEALGEGVQDIRKHMATKDGVDIAVEAAKIELKADIFASIAPMTRKVISNDRRVTALEEKTMPSRKLCKGRE